MVRKNRNGISSGAKIFWQTVITLVALAALLVHPASSEKIRELWVPFVKHPIIASMPIAALAVFVYLWIVGFSNAINLTDGLDGLAIGCTITVALTYGIMAYAAGNAKIADYLLISFVPGNGRADRRVRRPRRRGGRLPLVQLPPGRALHGRHRLARPRGAPRDHSLHGPAAAHAHHRRGRLRLGGGPVVIQVGFFKVTRRNGRARRFFLMAPIHHHFQKQGWPETKVVLRFWILSLIFALAGLGTLKIR